MRFNLGFKGLIWLWEGDE